MDEILDHTVPETSQFLDGKARGKSLRQFLTKKRLVDNLLKHPDFRKHHADLFDELLTLRDLPEIYGGVGLRAPKRRR